MSENFTVILDAGHGGNALAEGSTPNNSVGANGLLEKDLTLNLAKIAAEKLHSKGFRVFLTRDQDKNLTLPERARKSKEIGADAFVSIHFNGSKNEKIDGTEVFVSHASDEKDFALANELLTNTARAAEIMPRSIRQTNFTVLKGDFHVPKTAACLIEMAYLTNPQQANKLLSPKYVEHLAEAVAHSISNYSKRLSYAKSLEENDAKIEKKIAEISKEHSDPKNFPIDLPEPGKGTDTFQISIPKGLKFSRWEVEVMAISTGAGYKVAQSPKSGAEGAQQISVDWWHLPYGKINYKFIAYASPDGETSAVEKIVFEKAGWMEKAKDQIVQGNGLQLVVKGEKAKKIYEAMRKHQEMQGKTPQQMEFDDVSTAMEPVTITVVILVGIVIFGILVALGLIVLGTIIKMALDKGYNVKDTKFKAGVGEGQLRQDHEIAFNLTKPKKSSAQSFSFGLENDLNSTHFQPLDDFKTYALDAKCENPAEIKRGEEYTAFPKMSKISNHSGEKPNLFLRWCDIPKNKCEIDIVVHFHGFDIRNNDAKKKQFFLEYAAAISGLELVKPDKTLTRKTPTLCILPLGKNEPEYSVWDNVKKEYVKKINNDRYVFPFFNSESGLQDLIDFSLNYLAQKYKASFTQGRLILTAHSGGGAGISNFLELNTKGKLKLKREIDEIHLFDSTYGNQQNFIDWAKRKIDAGKDGALRVLCLPLDSDCSQSGTVAGSLQIEKALNEKLKSNPSLSPRFRVQKTRIRHNDIPKTFGFQLLADAGAKLDDTFAESRIHPCCQKEPAKCGVKEPFKQQSFEYDEPDYFAESETDFMNY